MRLLAVAPNYAPDPVGAWLTTHEYVRAGVSRGWRVHAIARLAFPLRYRIDGVCVDGGEGRLEQRIESAEIVVTHAGDDGLAHRLASERGKKTVVFVHSTPTLEMLRRYRQHPPTATIANARATARLVRWDGRLVVCPPCTFRDKHATTPGDRVTLVNLALAKGGRFFWRLARALPEIQFLGVRGGYGQQIEDELPNVEVLDRTTDMRRDVWSRTRVLLVPSLRESWGRVGLEACCSGIPVVASPTAGLRESLETAGRFVPLDDCAKWQREIRTLIEDESYWQRRSRLALERAERLDPEATLERFVELLESL